MKYSTQCEHCGNIIPVYTFLLSTPLVGALRRLVDAYENLHRPIHLQKDINLTKNQYTNFSKLRHFGLAHNIGTGYGCYVPTQKGLDFIYGRIPAPKRIKTMNNELVTPPHPAWQDEVWEDCYVQEVDVTSYKQREEYAEEKRQSLFDSMPSA